MTFPMDGYLCRLQMPMQGSWVKCCFFGAHYASEGILRRIELMVVV
ncbi:putative early Protein [Synechococcus sp. PROS-9-1]|nr:putative early Protein [Synechococcus sp. PROS-9-1]